MPSMSLNTHGVENMSDFIFGVHDFESSPWDGDSCRGNDDPIGSCENCGVNIYENDDCEGLCSQCDWSANHEQERDGDEWLGL